jgi:ribosomal protein RSM22 (predicted rRNA methylase)
MQLPIELQQAIENLAEGYEFKALKTARAAISEDYRQGSSSSQGFKDRNQLFSYLITRMPATFAACVEVFHEVAARIPDFSPSTLLDLGAGPGTASWAALDVFSSLEKILLIEREADAIEIGKKLTILCDSPAMRNAQWQQASLQEPFATDAVDMAVLSYVFSETSDLKIIDHLLESAVSLVIVIEPGTPKGFERIRLIRQHVVDRGAHLIAPCPHAKGCPMTGTDWCHFSARVERTRLHRLLKEGTLGYEDEKYSYVVFSKQRFPISFKARVVRHPLKASGFVRLPLCSENGALGEETVSRSHKEFYRKARDAEWGSAWM